MNKMNRYPNQPDNQIWFYDRGYNYYEFSNFFMLKNPIKVALPTISDGNINENNSAEAKEWKTSEHLFQALKFVGGGKKSPRLDLAENIRNCQCPSEVYELANGGNGTYKNEYDENWWKKVSLKVMKWVVRKKFFQDKDLKNLLWETGNKEIIENTRVETRWNDEFWGNGQDGKGQNQLGKILMEIRQEIVQELGEYIPETEKPTSPETPKNKEPNSTPEKDKKLFQAQVKAADEIITALYTQEPKIDNNELDYYQKWREILKELTDLDKIEIFKNDVIAHIKLKRKNKLGTEKVKNQIKNAQGKSGEELRKYLENLKKGEGEKSYQENQEAIEELSKKSAQEDPYSYQKMAVNLIRENLKNNQVEESELEKTSEIKDYWKKIKKGEINQPEEIVNTEKKINKKVNEIGAQKRFDKAVELAHQALKSGQKKQLEKALQEIVKIISSSNIYDQTLYAQQGKDLKQLKEKLENYSPSPSSDLSSKFPLKIIIPVSLLVILGIVLIIIINIRRKRKRLIKK